MRRVEGSLMIVVQAGFGDLLIGGLFVAAAFAFAAYGVVRHRRQRARIERSEPVEGTITGVSLTESTDTEDIDGGGQWTDTDYSSNVSFEYSYDGEEYEVSNRYPDSGAITVKWDSKKAAEERIEEYRETETVTVHVDPERPGEAFLDAQPTWGRNIGVVLIGLVFGVVQLAVLLAFVGVL